MKVTRCTMFYFLVSPTIEAISPITKTVNESDNVVFFCNASGLPLPSITWSNHKSGTIMSSSGTRLVFNGVKRTDSGTYVCTAINGVVRNDTASTVLNVQCKSIILKMNLIYPSIRSSVCLSVCLSIVI